MRAVFNASQNVAGKLRTESDDAHGVLPQVRRGVKQVFTRFSINEGGDEAEDEDDLRFETFRTKVWRRASVSAQRMLILSVCVQTLSAILKSAVASAGGTLIFVPSYFDFLRVQAHLKTIEDLEYACISE